MFRPGPELLRLAGGLTGENREALLEFGEFLACADTVQAASEARGGDGRDSETKESE